MNPFYERKNIDKSTVEFNIKIGSESFEQSYNAMLKDNLKGADVKGFRKGKVPTTLLEPHVKENVKLDTLEKLAPLYINTAITKESIEPIAPPAFKELPKIEDGKDVEFTVTVTVMPEFKLGNVKKVKIKEESANVKEEEIKDALDDLLKNQKVEEKELNDKWATEIAKALDLKDINNLDDLKKYIESAIKKQKEHMLMHKRQDDAIKEAIKLSNIEIPQPAIAYEATEREKSFVYDMQSRGIKVEDFLKANNITLEKMRELWIQDSKEALETDTLLKLYTKEKGISISQEDLDKKIEELKKSAPQGTDPKIYSDENWIKYIKSIEEKELAFASFVKEVLGESHKD